jgi:hypothetical protein
MGGNSRRVGIFCVLFELLDLLKANPDRKLTIKLMWKDGRNII